MTKKLQKGGLYYIPPISKIPSKLFSGGKAILVNEIYRSQEEFFQFFIEKIAVLFDQSGNFTLSKLEDNSFLNKDKEKINYAEQYAVLLSKDKKYKAAFELFSLIVDTKEPIEISKKILDNKNYFVLFGNKEKQLGILGMYFFAKTSIRQEEKNLGVKIINCIFKTFDQLSIDPERSVVDLLIACTDLIIKSKSFTEDQKKGWKTKKIELQRYLIF